MEASGSYNLFVRTANQTNHIHRGSWRRLSPEVPGWRLCPAAHCYQGRESQVDGIESQNANS